MITTKTSLVELLYLADQQRHNRCMMRDDDYGGTRASIIIEASLRRWAEQIGTVVTHRDELKARAETKQ